MKIGELFPGVLAEKTACVFLLRLDPDNPVHWAKSIAGYANGHGGTLFVGVSDNGEASGISIGEIDRAKSLIAAVNERHIFPHARISFMIRSADANAELFVLAANVRHGDAVARYCEGDLSGTANVNGPENVPAAVPADNASGNEITGIKYAHDKWTEYISLCRQYRTDLSAPSPEELKNQGILSKDGYAKSGFIMFSDNYDGADSLICCRLWKGKKKTGKTIESKRFQGSLARVFTEVLAFIERNTRTGWRKTDLGGREEIRSYPERAVREALVNAIAYRDCAISGTQIEVDVYCDRIDIVSPGAWPFPMPYDGSSAGSDPAGRRNTVIAACLKTANLLERGGGFQTMTECYGDCEERLKPVMLIHAGFLVFRLFDREYEDDDRESDIREIDFSGLTDAEKVLELLKEGPKPVRTLQETLSFSNRTHFLREVINPLMAAGDIYRDGNLKSPKAMIRLKGRP